MSIEIKCDFCGEVVKHDEQCYSLNLSKNFNGNIIETYPIAREQMCTECKFKMENFLVPDIQTDIMKRFDELVDNLKKSEGDKNA